MIGGAKGIGIGIDFGIPNQYCRANSKPYIEKNVLDSLRVVASAYGKSNNDSDRAIVKNLVAPDNPFVISNAAYTEGSGYADKGSPYYGAFVTDGVEDLITSTKTVQKMGITDEFTVVSMIHQIGGLNSSAANYGYTNYFRGGNQSTLRNNATGLNKTGIYGYSATNYTPTVINNILGDKNDYTTSSAGFSQLTYGNVFSVVGYKTSDTIAETSSVAWYWTIIANKVLTTDQINQVIAYFNLDRTLNPDILCDVKKQGITNENHAEFGDRLIDFSGNGRYIQLNNLAWKGNSGIGKYNFSNINIIPSNRFEGAVTTNKCHFTKKLTNATNNFCDLLVISPNEPIKFKVSGLSDGRKLFVANKSGSGSNYNFDNGEHEVSLSFSEGVGRNNPFGVTGDIGDIDVTVEFIPSHAGALWLDGVNDFGKVTGMPVYKDYTVVADYIRTSAKENATDSSILSKSKVINNGAFLFNYLNVSSTLNSYSFGTSNMLASISDSERKIYYQSKYVNEGKSINSGTGTDYDSMWLGTYRDNVQIFFNGAIYSLMSFPYSMSEFLIERQLKKHKLGTLYPDMVEFRPIVKSNNKWDIIEIWQGDKSLYRPTVNDDKTGIYLKKDSIIGIYVKPKDADEVTKIVVNGTEYTNLKINSNGFYFVTLPITKSPQKINIIIDEYIRYEDIVQPYPSFVKLENLDRTHTYTWGDKLKVGDIIRYNSSKNLLEGAYTLRGQMECNGVYVFDNNQQIVVTKEMVFAWSHSPIWNIDDNEPKCILSPRLLRIPNSSYKILGYIPDISGHGNNGVIHNSAYAEGSGVNEDGSYQFDGVDDFVTIPTTVGGKQVLMKVNWQKSPTLLYDQRASGSFAVLTTLEDDAVNPRIAYQARNQDGKTYIDGIENNNIETYTLKDITHNITIANSSLGGIIVPVIGCNIGKTSNFAKMSLYDFMLFDDISTDDKIKQLNEYVGIEGNVWGILTQLSNKTSISNETLIKNE